MGVGALGGVGFSNRGPGLAGGVVPGGMGSRVRSPRWGCTRAHRRGSVGGGERA